MAAVGGPAIGSYVEAPRAPVAQLPVSLPPRPALLAGREELLADLDARLTAGTWPRVVALHGLGGAGKTTVAVEYAHRHLAEVGLAWQFPAEDATVLVALRVTRQPPLPTPAASGVPRHSGPSAVSALPPSPAMPAPAAPGCPRLPRRPSRPTPATREPRQIGSPGKFPRVFWGASGRAG